MSVVLWIPLVGPVALAGLSLLLRTSSLRRFVGVAASSAVLVSAHHVLRYNAEIVKRWSNEIQEAVQSKNGTVQVC